VIRAESVSFSYAGTPAVRAVSFGVEEGEMTAVVGPNGSGKSTLMKLLARVLLPTEGLVSFRGRPTGSWDAREYARQVGYLPQDPHPAFSMRAREVVVSGRAPYLGRFRFEGEGDYAAAERALELCDAAHLGDRLLEEMSGGERQRVFLARVLAGEPKLILLDEPFAGLDLSHTQAMLEILRGLMRSEGLAVVFISHDLNWAAAFSSRIAVMNGGRMALEGPPSRVMTREVIQEHFAFRGEAVRAHGRDHDWIVPSP
jgi:ABC-type cobalamin/Fe3+-siderophores transport system ATPase subunit